VVPNTIKHTWWHEIHKFAGYQCSCLSDVIEGPKKKKLELWEKNSIFKIVNYESLRSDYDLVKEVYQNKVYSLILDECQAIKNWSQQTRKILDLFKFNPPKYFTALSGTPVANKPEDVYNVVRLTAPTLLGKDKRDFEARYCYLGGYTGNQIIGYRPQALETIHNAMARCSVRALRNEVGMNLGKLVEPVYLDMSKDQKSAHDALRDKFIADLMGWTDETPVRVNNALAQYIKLLEITSGFIYDNNGNVILTKDKDNVKIQWLDEYISDYLEDIEKLVIFTNFVPLIEFMAKRYARYSVEKVYGATKAEERQESVNRFTKGDSHIIIVNMSCAPGLDLNPAQFAIFMNRDFQLLKNLQAEDRITGYNQVGESTIIPILCNHSIDINLEKMLEVKKKKFDIVMEGKVMESSFNITKEDLKELLSDV
jgi:SNF2 family DNA or RNA helicase